MVAPRYRSRTFRRVKVRLPSGKTVTHYARRKPGRATCPVTGQELHGVPQMLPRKLSGVPKSSRRPSRPYGGVLSSKAMRAKMVEKARKLDL